MSDSDRLLIMEMSVTQIQKSLDDLTKSFESSMAKNVKATSKMEKAVNGAVGSVKKLGSALGITFGITSLTKTLLSAGKSYEESVDKYIAGSERLKGASGGGASQGAEMSVVGASKLETVVARSKQILASMTGALINTVTGKGAGDPDETKDAREVLQLNTDIAEKEDEIADLHLKGVVSIEEQLSLQKRLSELAQLRGRLAENALVADRKADNAAREAYGAAKTAQKNIKFEQEQALNAAKGVTDVMEQERYGRKDVADILAIQAKYQREIAAAQRAGNTELQKELNAQKEMELMKARVASHLMTPSQRRAERRIARKFARDSVKTDRAEHELQRRSEIMLREGHKATPGSELDRFQQRQTGRAAGGEKAEKQIVILEKIEANTRSVNDNI